MSVILQPYQPIPFSTSLDFQVSRADGGSLCTFQNYIDLGTFVPFAILSSDQTVGVINLYNCNDEWLQELSLTITSTQDPDTGLWFHYYNGDDLGLTCGTYYLTILVGDFIWYSEQFTIKDIVNNSQYPELIKDDYHLPLRIYDSITKQLINKSDIVCDVQPLNPVSTIMPFMFDTEEDINEVSTFLVNTCTGEEIDLSADLELEFIKSNPGGLVEQEVLTTSQQLRTEFYKFDSYNFIFQEFKINDTGKLKDITFEWYFGGEEQTITASLIKGTSPRAVATVSTVITDNASTSKEITIDYTLYDLDVMAGDVYLIKFSTTAQCSAAVGVNSVKIYADGQFAERNTVGQFKDENIAARSGNYYPPDFTHILFQKTSGNECFGTIVVPSEPGTYSYRYTATQKQVARIRVSNITGQVDGEGDAPVEIHLAIKKNDTIIHEYADLRNYYYGFTIPTVAKDVSLEIGDNITVICALYDPLGNIFANSFSTGSINLSVYNYTTESLDSIVKEYVHEGINYKNKSLWFNVNITKEVYEGGDGATQIYNPARPLPSPLPCGNYYIKLVSQSHTWYSEWFRVVNVGNIDLTQFVLGTEAGEIISNEDENLIFEV